jgi:hypothetical protein
MWNKILEINWRSRYGNRNEDVRAPIEGTNGATLETMTRVNTYIRQILSVVEAPVYGAAVFFILIMGEWNFWSKQVYYETEPMTAVGQWAPMAGTGLAVLGSLYIKVHKDLPRQLHANLSALHGVMKTAIVFQKAVEEPPLSARLLSITFKEPRQQR